MDTSRPETRPRRWVTRPKRWLFLRDETMTRVTRPWHVDLRRLETETSETESATLQLTSCWSPTNSVSRRNFFRRRRSPGRIMFSDEIWRVTIFRRRWRLIRRLTGLIILQFEDQSMHLQHFTQKNNTIKWKIIYKIKCNNNCERRSTKGVGHSN